MFDQITANDMVVGITILLAVFAIIGWWIVGEDDLGKDPSRSDAMDDEHRPPPGPWGGPL